VVVDLRRIVDAVRRHRPEAILDVHMSASLTLPTLAFCDSFWNGEQFENLKASDKFELPLHTFRTEFMGYANGLDAEFLCHEKRPFTLEEAIAQRDAHARGSRGRRRACASAVCRSTPSPG
jgi:hypothetical protein